jgi:hypothetical protein
MTTMTVDEMLRLACIYAEQDRRGFLDAIHGDNSPDGIALQEETRDFIVKLHRYRIKKWGKSKLQKAIDAAPLLPADQIIAFKKME